MLPKAVTGRSPTSCTVHLRRFRTAAGSHRRCRRRGPTSPSAATTRRSRSPSNPSPTRTTARRPRLRGRSPQAMPKRRAPARAPPAARAPPGAPFCRHARPSAGLAAHAVHVASRTPPAFPRLPGSAATSAPPSLNRHGARPRGSVHSAGVVTTRDRCLDPSSSLPSVPLAHHTDRDTRALPDVDHHATRG